MLPIDGSILNFIEYKYLARVKAMAGSVYSAALLAIFLVFNL